MKDNDKEIDSELAMAMYDSSVGKSYESDNEEEDKWDNIQKACWVGYVQRGMKDKNGRKVPNCVPVSKSESEPTTKSFWNGSFDPRRFLK
jgi:hypothetical protein